MAIALIVGASRGIGLELARQLNARGDDVIATCRTTDNGLSSIPCRVIDGVDVTSDEAVASLDARLGDRKLDALWVVSGLLRSDSLEELDLESVGAQLEVNAVGPLRVVRGLQHRMRKGGKVALVTSRMGSMADNSSGGAYGYRMSKAALNAAGVSLARDLAPREITVALLHPGWVRTDMTAHQGLIEAEESAALLIERLDALSLDETGAFLHANGDRLPF